MRDTFNKCDTCLNSRVIISENGYHSSCCLSDKEAVNCMIDREDKYIASPMKVNKSEVEE